MNKEVLIQAEFRAFETKEVCLILDRCQRFIEKNSENKSTSEELKGMVRMLRHIKQIPEEFEELKRNSSNKTG